MSYRKDAGASVGRRPIHLLWAALIIAGAALISPAQQTARGPAPAARLSPATPSFAGSLYQTSTPTTPQEAEEFIVPSRPSISNPAEFQKPGVLQVEYGYDADFRGEDFRTQQGATLTLRFAATKRLLLQFDFDTFESETDVETRMRETGVGDAALGFQVVALPEGTGHPAVAFAYSVKLPAASVEKHLGTGRFDHRFVGLLSKKVGENDIDFNVAYLLHGREGEPGWESGGLAAFSVSHDFKNNFGLQGELSGLSLDDEQPRGVYALGALTYQVNRRLIFDTGLRFGLNAEAPRVGVVAGLTVGVADFRRR